MTSLNNNGIISLSIREADFFCQHWALSKAREIHNCFSYRPLEQSPFYLGGYMTWDKTKRKLYYKRCPWAKVLNRIRSRCLKNGKYYSRGIKNFLINQDVKYLWERDKAWELKRPSIDRINTKGHYTLDNCRFIELDENNNRPRYFSLKTRKKLSRLAKQRGFGITIGYNK